MPFAFHCGVRLRVFPPLLEYFRAGKQVPLRECVNIFHMDDPMGYWSRDERLHWRLVLVVHIQQSSLLRIVLDKELDVRVRSCHQRANNSG